MLSVWRKYPVRISNWEESIPLRRKAKCVLVLQHKIGKKLAMLCTCVCVNGMLQWVCWKERTCARIKKMCFQCKNVCVRVRVLVWFFLYNTICPLSLPLVSTSSCQQPRGKILSACVSKERVSAARVGPKRIKLRAEKFNLHQAAAPNEEASFKSAGVLLYL